MTRRTKKPRRFPAHEIARALSRLKPLPEGWSPVPGTVVDVAGSFRDPKAKPDAELWKQYLAERAKKTTQVLPMQKRRRTG